MFLKKSEPENDSSIRSKLWKSRFLESHKVSDYFILPLFTFFLFQNICLNLISTTSISKTSYNPMDDPVSKITHFVSGVYDLNSTQNEQLYSAIAGFSAIYILFILAFQLYVVFRILKNSIVPEFSKTIFSYLKYIHLFIFSLPINNYLFKLIFDSTRNGLVAIDFPIVIGSGILIFLSLGFNFFVILTELPFINTCILTRSNNFFFWIGFLEMSIKGIYFGTLMGSSTDKINEFFIVLELGLNLSQIGGYIYFVPFLSRVVERLVLFSLSIKLAVSSANLIVFFGNDSNRYLFESFTLFCLILLVLIYKIIKIIANDDHPASVLDKDSLFIKNDFWFLRRINNFLKVITSSDHKLDMARDVFDDNKIIVNTNQDSFIVKNNLNEISESFSRQLLHLADRKFQNSELKMCIVKILIDTNSNFFQVYSLVQKMSKLERSPIKAVGFLILKRQMEDKNFKTQNDSNDCNLLKNYLEAILSEEHISKMIENFSFHQSKLYKLLQLHSPELIEIFQVVSILMNDQTRIQEYWNTIPQSIFNLNPELVRLYSEFIRPFDEVYSKNMMVTYRMIKNRLYSKDHKHFFDSQIDINAKTMHMLLSLEQSDFGKILLFSQKLPVLLKHNSQNMSNKNIKNFLPFSLVDTFESQLHKHSYESQAKHGIEPRTLFLMTSDSYLKPLTEYSHVLSIEHRGLCQFSILEFHKDGPEYMLIDTSGLIEASTKGISRDLNMDKLSRVSIKSLGDRAAFNYFAFIKKISTAEKMFISLPKNHTWVYECRILETANKNFYLIQAEKQKIKNISMDQLDIDESEHDIPIEYTDPEIKIKPEGNSSNVLPLSHLEVKDEAKKSIGQVTQIFSHHSSDDNEEIIDDGSKESSAVQSGLHQSSVNSSQSYLEQKKVELKETLGSLKFFKFTEKYIPIVSAFLFVGVYLFVIMYSYYNTTKVINDVSDRVYLFNQVSSRARYTLETCRNSLGNIFYQDWFPNGINAQRSNFGVMKTRIKLLAQFNSNIRTILGRINDDELIERFFQKNVKIYYDDFTDILKTDQYYKENSFTGTNMLINEANVLYKIAFNKSDFQNYVHEYIMTNSFNDLIIESESLFDFLIENIYNNLEVILQQESQFLAITLVLLFLCIISTQAVLYISYKKTNIYLSTFVDPSTNYLSEFVKDPSRKLKRGQVAKKDDKKANKKNELRNYKNPQSKRLLASFMIKMIYVMIFLIIPLILLIKNHVTIAETETRVHTTMNDVYNFNKIKISAYYTIILQIMAVVFREGYSRHIKNKIFFPLQIQKLSDVVSVEENFSEEALMYLHEDVCKYYSVHPSRPNCTLLGQGIAHSGIIQTINQVQAFLKNLESGVTLADGNKTLLIPYITDSKFVDNFFIVSNGINPATEYFQNQMTNNLLSDLEDTSGVILTLFAAGAAIGIIIMIVLVYTIWFMVGGDRRKIVQLMRLVPQEYLVRNREVKAYLIRQSDEATRYLKSIEKKMMPNE